MEHFSNRMFIEANMKATSNNARKFDDLAHRLSNDSGTKP